VFKGSIPITHISTTHHRIIYDLFSYRRGKQDIQDTLLLGNNSLSEFQERKDNNVILFHFIHGFNSSQLASFMRKYKKQRKIGLFLHTFFPFCEDGIFLSQTFTTNKDFLFFIENLDFIIAQDTYSYHFLEKYYHTISKTPLPKIVCIYQGIDEKDVISIKKSSDYFRVGFV